ncbi:YraN family protein [Thioclava sp. A2]|uniref:YraN family protein n=1 Tax=Thioclava sp. FCG-A2 TaxID=3080562 RepID=UPI002953A5DC|nr:YraN family protein [Thioclava sp. A2]MDV7271785.1 YraN family protein [Thioclava sp. A2]
MSGALSYHAGAAAEEQVAASYRADGFDLLEHRWRGKAGGEIDLILRKGDLVVFVEVKKSASHLRAAEHLQPRQIARLLAGAEGYARAMPDIATCAFRFDVALVDSAGRIERLENALSA